MVIRHVFKLLLLLISCSLSNQSHGQDLNDYNKALIWRGFEHNWTYNHRANRLGSFVSLNGEAYAVHTSATGLGSDSTRFTTYYSYIESPGIYFKEIPIRIRVNGKEGELLTKTEDVYYYADDWLKGRKYYTALINGFEIKSLEKSDQLKLFRFLVKDVFYSEESEEIKISADFNLVTNCRTIECPVFNNKTAYELTLHILIIAFDEGYGNVVDAYSSRNYVWDEKVEIQDMSTRVISLGQKDNLFDKATIGIKGFGIVLDSEHWLMEMNKFVIPNQYDPETGVMISEANMKYVEWKKGMQQFAVSPFKAKFAKRRSGYALLDMNLAMLQFKQAEIKHGKSTGSMFWRGWNQEAAEKGSQRKINIDTFINSH